MSMTDQMGLAPAAAPAGAALVKDTTTQEFARDVLDESKRQPVLVDFWAPWCGPCRTLSPIIEGAVKAARGAVRLVKMNIDDHPSVASQLGIQSIPAVVAFKNGQPVDGFIGALPEGQVKAFIERVAGPAGPSDVEALLAEADALLEEGDAAGASERYAAVLAEDATSIPAIAGLAACHLAAGNVDQARQTLAALPETAAKDARVAALQAQIELAAQTANLGDPVALEARIAANPKDYAARFDLALILNAKGFREAAADHLLEVVARDRNWEDAKAHKQLVQLFEAWGPTDPATLAGRRRLSSLLFA